MTLSPIVPWISHGSIFIGCGLRHRYLHIYGWCLESFSSTSFNSLSLVVKIKVFRALWIYPCGFLSSSLWACLRETLPDIIWEIFGCAKTNQRLVTKTCPKLDLVHGKTSAPHILSQHHNLISKDLSNCNLEWRSYSMG